MTTTNATTPLPTQDVLFAPQSESITNIVTALAKVQADIGKVVKKKTGKIDTKNGGSYSFKYADLSMIIDLVKGDDDTVGLFEQHGLFAQGRPIAAQGGVRVQTVILHTSGEWLADGAPFIPVVVGNFVDPKAYGIAISYLRRYGLASMLNIAQADNEDELSKSSRPTAAKKTPAVKLASIDAREALLVRIQELPEELRTQIASKLKDAGVVWTQLSDKQLKTATEWTTECEGIAEAGAE